MINLDSVLKRRDITLPTKIHLAKATVFSSNHVWLWELDYKESWVPKNWRFLTVVLEKTLESPLDSKEIKPVNPKRNKPWVGTGRTDAEAPILWPPDAKSQLTVKDLDAGKDGREEEKGVTEDEMVGWHHWLNGQVSLGKLREMVKGREAWRAVVYGVAKIWTWLSDWTIITAKVTVMRFWRENKRRRR